MRRLLLVSALVGALLAGLAPRNLARADRTHRVRSGETPAQIARRYGVTAADLLAANDLSRARSLRVGQVLLVPARGVAYARPGDTLSSIASRHRCSVQDLQRLNRLRSGSTLRVGQRLVLPGYLPPDVERDWGEPDEPGVVTLVRGELRERVRLVASSEAEPSEGALPRLMRMGLETLTRLLRREDVPDDAKREVDPRLAYLLAFLSDAFGGRPIVIVSGFRDAERYTDESSRHVASAAADIRILGVPERAVWERCRRIRGAGCGFYPRSTFVHVDAREDRTQWVDWSGPGQRPRYGTLRGPARRGHRSIPFPSVDGHVPAEVLVVDGRAVTGAGSPRRGGAPVPASTLAPQAR